MRTGQVKRGTTAGKLARALPVPVPTHSGHRRRDSTKRGLDHEVFGNRVSTYSSANSWGIVPLRYGPDNRLVARDSTPGCTGEHYWSDQAGRRLGSTTTLYTAPADSGFRTTLSYTAQGQLYYAVTPTDDIGHWDYTWHWYDGQGRRLMR